MILPIPRRDEPFSTWYEKFEACSVQELAEAYAKCTHHIRHLWRNQSPIQALLWEVWAGRIKVRIHQLLNRKIPERLAA